MIDLFIIGGGINGVGIAADAAGRGLNVVLCEQSDLASGTSSASTKIIHGGLRYLEQFEFHLVRKALKEREILWQKAPHIITPLTFVLPYVPGLRSHWLLQSGLWLYDHLAPRKYLPSSQALKMQNNPYATPLVDTITRGFTYPDCWVDDARLVILNAITAKEHGAIINNYEKVIHAQRQDHTWVITTSNQLHQQQHTYHAKILINAAGPWVRVCHEEAIEDNGQPLDIELVKGSHIVVPRLFAGEQAYVLMAPDKRLIFVIPYLNHYTLIGTTEERYRGDPHLVTIESWEIEYLCSIVNQYFKRKITTSDVVWSYSGVRPLQPSTRQLRKISRDYQFHWDNSSQKAPLLTIIGGKITTYRELAEQAVNQLAAYFPKLTAAWTAKATLPGGDLPHADLAGFIEQCQQQYSWLPAAVCQRYAHAYGTRIHVLLEGAYSLTDLGHDFGHGLYEKEVIYLVDQEWAMTAEDILWRRTKLGIEFSRKEIDALKQFLT